MRRLCGLILACSVGIGSVEAQLRVVTYNTTGGPDAGMDVVLRSIGEETRNGIARPIDILLLQEQSRAAGLPNTQAFVNLLNSIYVGQGISYARGNTAGLGDATQTIVYRTDSVELVSEAAIGTTMPSGQPRQTMRFEVKPAGYDASIYIYNSHYKAGQGTDSGATLSNANRRLLEATAIRADADALDAGVRAIYSGDLNFYDSDASEPAFGKLVSPGNGRANDPVNRIGSWHEEPLFADVHSQSPCTSGCGITSGMDDRFDFQLVTDELVDGDGLAYIGGSYHAFGNNGTTYNTSINAAGNTVVFPGVLSHTKLEILNALVTVTDHIPVVADYQLPAVMQLEIGSIPATLGLYQTFSLSVTVSNAASVLAPLGADELRYDLAASGALSGSFVGQSDMALGGANTHFIALDTSAQGVKTGSILVSSTSEDVKNLVFQLPITFEVLGTPGDYNRDNIVDAADYVVWRNALGQMESLPNDATPASVSQADYEVWRRNFGVSLSAPLRAAVPETTTSLLVVWATPVLVKRRRRKNRLYRDAAPGGRRRSRSLSNARAR